MFQPKKFTNEEEKEFNDWDFRKKRGEQLLWCNNGIPMNARHQEWLQEKERRERAARTEYARPSFQQPTWGSPQSYSSYSPNSCVTTSESFEERLTSNPPEGPSSPNADLSDDGDYRSPQEPNLQVQKLAAGFAVTQVCPSCCQFDKFALR